MNACPMLPVFYQYIRAPILTFWMRLIAPEMILKSFKMRIGILLYMDINVII